MGKGQGAADIYRRNVAQAGLTCGWRFAFCLRARKLDPNGVWCTIRDSAIAKIRMHIASTYQLKYPASCS